MVGKLETKMGKWDIKSINKTLFWFGTCFNYKQRLYNDVRSTTLLKCDRTNLFICRKFV